MKSQLNFKNFVVPKIIFEKLDTVSSENEFIILPQAVINRHDKQFHINFDVEINDVEENFMLKLMAVGIFEYEIEDNDESTLLNFMSLNGPAIIFPYIRSFISSFTSISGFSTVTLPTLNLSSFKQDLIDNLIEIGETAE